MLNYISIRQDHGLELYDSVHEIQDFSYEKLTGYGCSKCETTLFINMIIYSDCVILYVKFKILPADYCLDL